MSDIEEKFKKLQQYVKSILPEIEKVPLLEEEIKQLKTRQENQEKEWNVLKAQKHKIIMDRNVLKAEKDKIAKDRRSIEEDRNMVVVKLRSIEEKEKKLANDAKILSEAKGELVRFYEEKEIKLKEGRRRGRR